MSMLGSAPAVESQGMGSDAHRAAGVALPTRKIALGEELPIFCEKCGYALHGLPQIVCDHCTIRQFKCPECGHHQPINTLRPAAQKMLGRVRAAFLVLVMFFKINFFGWILFGWVAGGTELAYQYDYRAYQMQVQANPGPQRGRFVQRNMDYWVAREPRMEEVVAVSVLGLLFGMFGRMLLLRWRHGYFVGMILGALTVAAFIGGGYFTKVEREIAESFFSADYFMVIGLLFVAVAGGASVVWGVWVALAHVFLPRRTSSALLEWQTNQSQRAVAVVGRE